MRIAIREIRNGWILETPDGEYFYDTLEKAERGFVEVLNAKVPKYGNVYERAESNYKGGLRET